MKEKLAVMILSLMVITLSIILISIFLMYNPDKNGFGFSHSYTKAICDENNKCEDYEIYCNENRLLKLNPTGFAVQFPKDWEDPRSGEDIEKIC